MPLDALVLVALIVVVLASAAVAVLRWRRRRRRDALVAERELLRAERERADAAIRQALLAALDGPEPRFPPGSGPVVLLLGVGAVEVAARSHGPASAEASTRIVPSAPLLVSAADGVRVLGPPGLATIVAESYRRRLAGVGPPDGAAGWPIEVAGDEAEPRSDGAAEVWIGPDGGCAARSPRRAGGRWVPLELRL